MSQARAAVVGPGEGATIEGPAGGPLTFKVRGDHTNGSLTAFENIIAPDDGPPLHVHTHEDEAWYLLEGELRFRLGADIRVAATGSFVFVPRGVPHCFRTSASRPPASSCCSRRLAWSSSSTASPRFRTVP